MVEIGNYQGREVGLGGGCLSQCVRAKKNFWGPRKFGRLLWDQGLEYVTGTGSWKKTFGAPESLVGFRGTRGSNMCRGQDRGKKLLGPRKVWSAFVGPGVRICDWDRIAEKNFSGPRKFFSHCHEIRNDSLSLPRQFQN